ncbi:hypothetical protein C8Q80DRAFT_1357905 [Daedaleopsis nitida]|nr:hypothetical protein C8Q80DRAFT_1357905 [Daedaleopsis nitida]
MVAQVEEVSGRLNPEEEEVWRATIENYTVLYQTRCVRLKGTRDKLVALAEEFSFAIQSRYLAGLWARTLLPDLIWCKGRAAHIAPRPQIYRAPSWSAAVVAEVVACETVLKNPELPSGEVVGGTLVLRELVAVDCVMLPHWRRCTASATSCWCPTPRLSAVLRDGSISSFEEMLRRMHEIGLCCLDSDEDGNRNGVKRVSVVPLYARWESTPDGHRVVHGFVLERLDLPLAGSQSNIGLGEKYRRIGFFEGC